MAILSPKMAAFCGIFKQLASSLPPIYTKQIVCSFQTHASPLFIKSSNILYGEPLKRKKRVDPQILRKREERKRKRIEKSIRKLEKVGRKFKPITESEIPRTLLKELSQRKRSVLELSEEEIDHRSLIEKEWNRYKMEQYQNDYNMIHNILLSQKRALEALKEESEELYQEAILPDPFLLPYQSEGPTDTPPIADYESPDGDYFDVTEHYDKKVV